MSPRSTINKTSDGKKQTSLRSSMAASPTKLNSKKPAETESKNPADTNDVVVLSDSEVNSEDAVALAADDTMFKPATSKSKLGSTKPTVKTRGANGISMKRKNPDNSSEMPTKDVVESTPSKSNRRVNAQKAKQSRTTKPKEPTVGSMDITVISDQDTGGDIKSGEGDYANNHPNKTRSKKQRLNDVQETPEKESGKKAQRTNASLAKTKEKNRKSVVESIVIDVPKKGPKKTPSKKLVDNKRLDRDGEDMPEQAHSVIADDEPELDEKEVEMQSDASKATTNQSDGEDINPETPQKARRGNAPNNVLIVSESEKSDQSEGSDVNMDQYDLSDSFIDDSEVISQSSEKNPFVENFKTSGRKTREKLAVPVIHSAKDKGKARFRESPDWDASRFDEDENENLNRDSGAENSDDEAEAALMQQAVKESLMSTPTTSIGRNHASAASSSKSGRRTFKDLVGDISNLPPQPHTPTPAYRDPVNEYRVKKLPKKCEVFNPLLQDAFLQEFYVGLPPLFLCVFKTWAQNKGPGQYRFSSWGTQCPDMDVEMCLSIINFVEFGRFINPSRANPMITTALKVTEDGFRSNLMKDGVPVILISTMYSAISHLHTPSTVGMPQKYISGVSHSQEWERQVSFIGMAFGQSILHAQIKYDALSYSTKVASRSQHSNYGFSAQPSPATSTSGNTFEGVHEIALNIFDIIYDARNTLFDAQKDWPNLATVLPLFRGEVPRGSFIAVGYTCNTYFASEKWSVSPNVQFVVVLGTPQ